MLKKIFFQSSMPRSGSTLFQCILNNNTKIYGTGTDGCLELLYGARSNFSTSPEFKAQDSELMKKAFINFCNKGMKGYCESLIDGTEKEYVVLKSRGWGVYRPFLNEIYPNPKVICLVRDLRSIVSSYEKIYRKNPLKHDPIRNDSTGAGTTIHKRVDEWMHPTNTIGRALERIFEIVRLGYDKDILFVKYEDLCLYPERKMRSVYEYLELPYFEHDFDNIEQTIKEDDSVYGLTKDLHTIKPKLELPNPDYHDVLGKDVCAWLYNTYKWYFDMFGYRGSY
jgi:sulfotransferase